MDGTYSKNKVDLIETVKFSFDKPNIPTLRQKKLLENLF